MDKFFLAKNENTAPYTQKVKATMVPETPVSNFVSVGYRRVCSRRQATLCPRAGPTGRDTARQPRGVETGEERREEH